MSVFSIVKHRLLANLAIRHGPKQPTTTKSRNLVPRIPHDILELIFYELRKCSVEALVSAMAVCREWREAGESLLWTHAVLRPSHVNAFVAAIKPRYAEYLHSLRISFNSAYSIVRSEDLSLVPTALECLPNLTVFSLRISIVRFDYRIHRDLEQIVTALPPSTKSLQIEFGADIAKDTHGNNCHTFTIALRKLLPQLRHLKIFGKICCQHLFEAIDTPCPRLESMILNCFPDPVPVVICGNALSHTDNQPVVNLVRIVGDHIVLKASEFAKSGVAPSLHTFTIVHRHHDKRYYVRQRRPAELLRSVTVPVAVQVKRILLEQTSVFPVLLDGHDHIVCVRLSANGTPEDFWGNKYDVAYVLEGDDAWYRTATGSVFPPTYRTTETEPVARFLREQESQSPSLEIRNNLSR